MSEEAISEVRTQLAQLCPELEAAQEYAVFGRVWLWDPPKCDLVVLSGGSHSAWVATFVSVSSDGRAQRTYRRKLSNPRFDELMHEFDRFGALTRGSQVEYITLTHFTDVFGFKRGALSNWYSVVCGYHADEMHFQVVDSFLGLAPELVRHYNNPDP